MSLGTYRQGADLVIDLDITSGMLVGTPSAAMVHVLLESVNAIVGPRIPLAVALRYSGNVLVGLTLSLPGAQTALLAPGIYAVDAKSVDSAGGISITDAPCFITLLPAAV